MVTKLFHRSSLLGAVSACLLAAPIDLHAAAGQVAYVAAVHTGGAGSVYLGPSYIVPATGDGYANLVVGDATTGAVTHSSAALNLTVSGYLYLGLRSGQGSYTLTGTGVLSTNVEEIGTSGTGTFTHDGGTNTIAGTLYLARSIGSNGSYTLSGTGALSANTVSVGDNGTGTFVQTGGTHTLTGSGDTLYVARFENSRGRYELSGGTLSAENEEIGRSGTGVFTQSGGTNSVEKLFTVGNSQRGNGSYTLSGTGTLSAETETIGGLGAGAFLQEGGTNTAVRVRIGNGSYSLNGGVLRTSEVEGSGLFSKFNFNGGVLQIIQGPFIGFDFVANTTVQAGGAKIDTNGIDFRITSALGHDSSLGGIADGGLMKQGGDGILILSGANTYTGSTTINAGTLQVNGTHTVASGTAGSYVVNSGGTLGGTGTVNLAAVNQRVVVNSGGKLSPGASAGTLTLALGTGALDISGAASGANTGALVFELAGVNASDKISLTSGFLDIGAGALEFGDFSFTSLTGFAEGVYTLFDTNSAINGSLADSGLSGAIGTKYGTIGLSGNGQDLLLTVVPEPSTYALCILGVFAGFWRMRRRGGS